MTAVTRRKKAYCWNGGKVRYGSASRARRARDRLREGHRQDTGGVLSLRVYRCGYCHGWHLTSEDERKP